MWSECKDIPLSTPEKRRHDTVSASGDYVSVSWVGLQQRCLVDAFQDLAGQVPALAAVLDRHASDTSLRVVAAAPGCSLHDVVQQRLEAGRPLGVATVWQVLVQCVSALDALHTRGIVHGDIAGGLRLDPAAARAWLGLPLLGRPPVSRYPAPEARGTGAVGQSDVFELGCACLVLLHLDTASDADALRRHTAPAGGGAAAAEEQDIRFLLNKMTEPQAAQRPTVQHILAYSPVRERLQAAAQPPQAPQPQPQPVPAEGGAVPECGAALQEQLSSLQAEVVRLRAAAADADTREEAVAKREAVCSDRERRVAGREAKVAAFLQLYGMTAEQLHCIPTCPQQWQLYADYYSLAGSTPEGSEAQPVPPESDAHPPQAGAVPLDVPAAVPHTGLGAATGRQCARELSFSDSRDGDDRGGAHHHHQQQQQQPQEGDSSQESASTHTQAGVEQDTPHLTPRSASELLPEVLPSPIRSGSPSPAPPPRAVAHCPVVHESFSLCTDSTAASPPYSHTNTNASSPFHHHHHRASSPSPSPAARHHHHRHAATPPTPGSESRVEEITLEDQQSDSSDTRGAEAVPPGAGGVVLGDDAPHGTPPLGSATPPCTHEQLIAWHLQRSPEKYLTPQGARSTPLQKCRLDPESGCVVKPWQRRSIQGSLQHSRAVLEDMAQRHRAHSREARQRPPRRSRERSVSPSSTPCSARSRSPSFRAPQSHEAASHRSPSGQSASHPTATPIGGGVGTLQRSPAKQPGGARGSGSVGSRGGGGGTPGGMQQHQPIKMVGPTPSRQYSRRAARVSLSPGDPSDGCQLDGQPAGVVRPVVSAWGGGAGDASMASSDGESPQQMLRRLRAERLSMRQMTTQA